MTGSARGLLLFKGGIGGGTGMVLVPGFEGPSESLSLSDESDDEVEVNF